MIRAAHLPPGLAPHLQPCLPFAPLVESLHDFANSHCDFLMRTGARAVYGLRTGGVSPAFRMIGSASFEERSRMSACAASDSFA